MVSCEEFLRRRQERLQVAKWRLRVKRPFSVHYQIRAPLWVGLERILNLVCGCFAVDQISWIDLANEVFLQDIVDILFLVNGKDVPIRIYTAASGPKNDFASGMTLATFWSALITVFCSQFMRKTYTKSVIS